MTKKLQLKEVQDLLELLTTLREWNGSSPDQEEDAVILFVGSREITCSGLDTSIKAVTELMKYGKVEIVNE